MSSAMSHHARCCCQQSLHYCQLIVSSLMRTHPQSPYSCPTITGSSIASHVPHHPPLITSSYRGGSPFTPSTSSRIRLPVDVLRNLLSSLELADPPCIFCVPSASPPGAGELLCILAILAAFSFSSSEKRAALDSLRARRLARGVLTLVTRVND